jgi:hypothetical protein
MFIADVHNMHIIELFSDKDRKNLPYTVNITNDSNETSTYNTNELSTNTRTVALNLIGRFVTISVNRKSKLAVCEVSVFGGNVF